MTYDERLGKMWETLLDLGVSEETLQVVTDINGYNERALLDILYATQGENMFDWEDEDEE